VILAADRCSGPGLLARLCVLGLDGFWFAVALEREADFFQVNPRANESGFDVSRYGRVVCGGECNGLQIDSLR